VSIGLAVAIGLVVFAALAVAHDQWHNRAGSHAGHPAPQRTTTAQITADQGRRLCGHPATLLGLDRLLWGYRGPQDGRDAMARAPILPACTTTTCVYDYWLGGCFL